MLERHFRRGWLARRSSPVTRPSASTRRCRWYALLARFAHTCPPLTWRLKALEAVNEVINHALGIQWTLPHSVTRVDRAAYFARTAPPQPRRPLKDRAPLEIGARLYKPAASGEGTHLVQFDVESPQVAFGSTFSPPSVSKTGPAPTERKPSRYRFGEAALSRTIRSQLPICRMVIGILRTLTTKVVDGSAKEELLTTYVGRGPSRWPPLARILRLTVTQA